MKRLSLVLIVLLGACALKADQARANHCSDPMGLYIDAAYQPCCVAHDEAYARGGTEADRLAADRHLYLCIRDLGHEKDAASMFMAVRLFGASRFGWRE